MKSKILILSTALLISFSVFAQKADMSLIPYRQGDLWGYASTDRTIVIKPQFDDAELFHEGFAVVKKVDKYGYINTEGKIVIPIKYYKANAFRFGFFPVAGKAKSEDNNLHSEKTVLFAGASLSKNGYEICIDTKGQQMPKCPAIPENSAPDINKPQQVVETSNYSTIQKSELFDKIVDNYKLVPGADQSYYIATRNKSYGVINNSFQVILPFDFTMITKKNMGGMMYLLAEKNGMHGVFFGNGSPYISMDNTKLQTVSTRSMANYFIVTKDGKTGVKDLTHNFIVESKYADIVYDGTGDGFILTSADGKKGYRFTNGKIVEPEYADIKCLPNGEYIKIKTMAGKSGYINNQGLNFFEE